MRLLRTRDGPHDPLGKGRCPGCRSVSFALRIEGPMAAFDQAKMRGAAVALSPVFGVPVGSISRICTSPRATGRCSTPVGTTKISPGLRVMVRSRSSMSSVTLEHKKKIVRAHAPPLLNAVLSNDHSWRSRGVGQERGRPGLTPTDPHQRRASEVDAVCGVRAGKWASRSVRKTLLYSDAIHWRPRVTESRQRSVAIGYRQGPWSSSTHCCEVREFPLF
jgi:hypothetical protein